MTAAELLSALQTAGCDPTVAEDELVLSYDPPPALAPAVALLHTGVRAILTGKRWYGCDTTTGRTVALEPEMPTMASLFKPTRPFPLPAGAEVVAHKCKPHARVGGALDRLTKDGKKFLKPTASYYADIPQADGRRKWTKLSPNKVAAQMMLTVKLKRIENEKAGVVDRFTDHKKKPLAELLTDWEGSLTASGRGTSTSR